MVCMPRPALVATVIGLALTTSSMAQPVTPASPAPNKAQPANKTVTATTKNPAVGAKLPDRVSPVEGEPNVKRTVIEDDATRIEEVRVRGQAQRVVVTNKNPNVPAWEIRTDTPGRVGAVESRLPRDSANPRVWSVLSF
jgi:hypothetical protein